jgi:hypothetical protein
MNCHFRGVFVQQRIHRLAIEYRTALGIDAQMIGFPFNAFRSEANLIGRNAAEVGADNAVQVNLGRIVATINDPISG